MSGVELDYVVPGEELARCVSLFYHFRADVPMFEDVERAQTAQLRMRLTPGRAWYRMPDGREEDAPQRHVLGPTSGSTLVRAEGPLRVFGFGLTPAGWSALIGLDACDATDQVLDADDIFGPALADAAALLAEARDAETMVAMATPLLHRLVARERGAADRFCAAVDSWLGDGPSPEVADLEVATGLSRRQVERRCNKLYGAPPKLLARKYRALRAAVALAAGELAVPDGFYDQSHMIREIKQFTGLTPKRLRNAPGLLAGMTISRRTALSGKIPAIVSHS